MDASHYNKLIFEGENRFGKEYNRLFEHRTRKVMDMLSGGKGRFLDIGCGDGSMALQIRDQLNYEVEGAELIAENVEAARAKGLQVRQVDLNREKLPYPDNHFDSILAGEVVEHLIDPEGFLADVKRILKKGGALVVTVPNIAAWYNRFLVLLGFVPHWVESGSTKAYGTPLGTVNGHVKAFNRQSIVEMLQDAGFIVQEVRGSGFNKVPNKELEELHGKGIAKVGGELFFLAENLFSRRSSLATNILVKATCP